MSNNNHHVVDTICLGNYCSVDGKTAILEHVLSPVRWAFYVKWQKKQILLNFKALFACKFVVSILRTW